MKRMTSTLALTAVLAAFSAPAFAQSQGDWTVGIGFGNVNPKSGNGTLANLEADVDDNTRPIFTLEYFIRDNIGIELLAATPFSHTVTLSNGATAGKVKQLPPTLSVNYHIPTNSKFTPFFGVGLNYTTFFEEESALGTLKLDDSWGIALNAGVDYAVSDKGAVRFNVRWIDIDSDVTLDGGNIGTAEIDPIVISASYVHRF
ncbi:OmpW family protein [Shimia sp. R10_1]|uniref:OmpW/AlkL family protein n=1 Tax=Shimia sp. R10_1 TaxID=2821095 RepID=UPI001ADAFA5C|nr:OmpW family outer membrane protein [Shimia sp. R10_1]MBO9475162.1 OmpW family protein [Shimia sp. R10_1]